MQKRLCSLRYIFFHHQTTTAWYGHHKEMCCVISSFITKPQPTIRIHERVGSCVISSFITKPQPVDADYFSASVALYLLSSPNHNQLSSFSRLKKLRYIFFHHQTTTCKVSWRWIIGCVISSFITKPQPASWFVNEVASCVISSFITKPQPQGYNHPSSGSCVISSFITKPQPIHVYTRLYSVALYLLSSPNHNIF